MGKIRNGHTAKTKEQQVVHTLTQAELEKGLPKKKKRSHHVVVKLEHIDKDFKIGERKVRVLKDIDMNLYSGEFAIVFGPSGCGKSTLLHTITGLEPPTNGKAFLRQHNLYEMKENERAIFRREKIGMVFQQSNWIKAYNVVQNVAYPLYLAGFSKKKARERAEEVLDKVGMLDFAKSQPTELSGGEQQRVALARALSTDPWMIVADEPTGNLDTESSLVVMKIFAKLNRIDRKIILMVTHDISFLPLATRKVGMRDGGIEYDENTV